jgi:hypothetical protein
MQKPAPAQHQVHELIQHRWSPRAFSDQPVPAGVLRSLFEAARWAPSSSNEQPWAFLVTTTGDKENHAKMLSTLVEFNQGWAKHAPVLAIAVSELAFAQTGKPNRNAFYDTGAAMANLSAEATSRGLFVHQMAGSPAGGSPSPPSRSATLAIRILCPIRCASVNSRRASESHWTHLSWAGIGERRLPSSRSNPHELSFYRGNGPACTARSNSW